MELKAICSPSLKFGGAASCGSKVGVDNPSGKDGAGVSLEGFSVVLVGVDNPSGKDGAGISLEGFSAVLVGVDNPSSKDGAGISLEFFSVS